jgi:hypothetical protein
MGRSTFTDERIAFALTREEAGAPVEASCWIDTRCTPARHGLSLSPPFRRDRILPTPVVL